MYLRNKENINLYILLQSLLEILMLETNNNVCEFYWKDLIKKYCLKSNGGLGNIRLNFIKYFPSFTCKQNFCITFLSKNRNMHWWVDPHPPIHHNFKSSFKSKYKYFQFLKRNNDNTIWAHIYLYQQFKILFEYIIQKMNTSQ